MMEEQKITDTYSWVHIRNICIAGVTGILFAVYLGMSLFYDDPVFILQNYEKIYDKFYRLRIIFQHLNVKKQSSGSNSVGGLQSTLNLKLFLNCLEASY